MPTYLAANAGVQRISVFTVPLDLTAVSVTEFVDGVKYETTMRCCLPLTIKRTPDRCGALGEMLSSPPIRERNTARFTGGGGVNGSGSGSLSGRDWVGWAWGDGGRKDKGSAMGSLRDDRGPPSLVRMDDSLSLAQYWEAAGHAHPRAR